MVKLILRIILAAIAAIGLTITGVKGIPTGMYVLFAILCAVFFSSMLRIAHTDLKEVLNPALSKSIRLSISRARNALIYDFGVSVLALFIALLCSGNAAGARYAHGVTIDVTLIAISIMCLSIVYQTYNSLKIRNLNADIKRNISKENEQRQ